MNASGTAPETACSPAYRRRRRLRRTARGAGRVEDLLDFVAQRAGGDGDRHRRRGLTDELGGARKQHVAGAKHLLQAVAFARHQRRALPLGHRDAAVARQRLEHADIVVAQIAREYSSSVRSMPSSASACWKARRCSGSLLAMTPSKSKTIACSAPLMRRGAFSPACTGTFSWFDGGGYGTRVGRRCRRSRVVGVVEVDRVDPGGRRLDVQVAARLICFLARREVDERHEQRSICLARRRQCTETQLLTLERELQHADDAASGGARRWTSASPRPDASRRAAAPRRRRSSGREESISAAENVALARGNRVIRFAPGLVSIARHATTFCRYADSSARARTCSQRAAITQASTEAPDDGCPT